MRALVPLVRTLSGGGGDFLRGKREYHRQRDAAERSVLATPERFEPNTCPACGERLESAQRFANPLGARFVLCPADGTVYADPVPNDDSLQWLQNHPSQAWPFLQGGRVAPRADELTALERMMPSGGPARLRLLDVGCGTGGFLLAARARFEVEGVEIHAAAAEVARSNGLSVTVGRLERVDLEGKFDVVTLICVLEHSARPAELLAAARRLLAPGGRLYVVTPNIASASFRYLGAKHSHLSSVLNVSLFTQGSLQRLGERCGFRRVAAELSGGRDLSLSDVLFSAVAPTVFRHRMSAYRPRVHHALQLVEQLIPVSLERRVFPDGDATFQRALWVAA